MYQVMSWNPARRRTDLELQNVSKEYANREESIKYWNKLIVQTRYLKMRTVDGSMISCLDIPDMRAR